MRFQDWFTSNLDETQSAIVQKEMNKSFVVSGSAGSGKTILALNRAVQASLTGTFEILVFTKALKVMIEYGLKVLDLPQDTVAYEWSWNNHGVGITGDVYAKVLIRSENGEVESYDDCILYLHNNDIAEIYSKCNQERIDYFNKIKEDINKNIKNISFKERKKKEEILNRFVTIDYANYVSDKIFYTFYRRSCWFEKVSESQFLDVESNTFDLLTSATLYKKKIPVDHMIIDEAQDFSINEIKNFKAESLQSTVFFGDSVQQVYEDRGVSMDTIVSELQLPRYSLSFNYRLPKAVAKIAELISSPRQDLVSFSKKNNGNSDFPFFPKPIVKECDSYEEEVDFVLDEIGNNSLTDVGILVPSEEDVKFVWNILQERGIDSQVKFNERFVDHRGYNMFRQVDTLDFSNPDIPSILTFHSAKGTQFDNVFILFAEEGEVKRNPFYVAITRPMRQLYITFTHKLTKLFKSVPVDYYDSF